MRVTLNGEPVHAATGGVTFDPDSQDPALILIHGAGMDSSVWSLHTRYLAYRNLRVLAVDLPGHGSSGGEAPATITQMADWVAEFIAKAANLESAHIVGHSMGSFVALELASQHPELVDSIVLIGAAPSMPVHPDLLRAASDDVALAAGLMTGWSHAKGNHLNPHPSPGLSMTGGSRALIERSGPGVLANDLAACAAYDGADTAVAALGCPATVIIGGADKMTPPKAGRALAEALGAEVKPVNEAGHMVMIEAPAVLRRLLVDAVRGVPRARVK